MNGRFDPVNNVYAQPNVTYPTVTPGSPVSNVYVNQPDNCPPTMPPGGYQPNPVSVTSFSVFPRPNQHHGHHHHGHDHHDHHHHDHHSDCRIF